MQKIILSFVTDRIFQYNRLSVFCENHEKGVRRMLAAALVSSAEVSLPFTSHV